MAQTIIQIDEQDLYNKIDKIFTKMSDGLHMNKRFGVGEGYNRKDFVILQRLQRVLCSCGEIEDCEIEYINNIINGLQ